MENRQNDPGARSVEADGASAVPGRKRGGLIPLILGAVALLIIGTALLASFGGNDSDGKPDIAGLETTSGDERAPTEGASVGQPSDGETLTAAGQSLLERGVQTDGLVGETATGRVVTVREVVDGEGFFVGETEDQRVYVEFGGDVGEDETSGGLPAEGDRVDLTGPVRPAPENPGRTLNLSESQAASVRERGFFVNADEVAPR